MERLLLWIKKKSPECILVIVVVLVLHILTSCALYEGARRTAEDKVKQMDVESCKKISSRPEECERAYDRPASPAL